MMTNKWVQASLVFGFCVGLWIGSWIALIFSPWVLFVTSYFFAIPTLYLGARARGTEAPTTNSKGGSDR